MASEEDDIEGIFDDAPDDLDDEDELLAYFAERLDIDEDALREMIDDATETAGTVAALALLQLFSSGWEALDDAQQAAVDAATEHVGAALVDRLGEIATDLADDLADRLDEAWGDEDGSSISTLAEVNAQSEYSDAKSEADAEEGWEFSQYLAEADACDVCQGCHGTVLPSDNPWWDDHEPDANHPNCRCVKVPLSEAEAKTRGIDKDGPDVEVSGWKDRWPPDVSDYPDVLQGIYHSKAA